MSYGAIRCKADVYGFLSLLSSEEHEQLDETLGVQT